jgi:hypothetical protein
MRIPAITGLLGDTRPVAPARRGGGSRECGERYDRRELLHELERLEHDVGRAVAAPSLQPIEQPAA